MSQLAQKIKKFYDKGIYTQEMVYKFYQDGKITEEEYNWIIGANNSLEIE